MTLPGNEAPSLAQLMFTHDALLIHRTVEQAQAQVPWYRTLAPDTLHRMFVRDYQALVQALQSNDSSTLRTYVEQMGEERIVMGATAENLIASVTLIEESVRWLIDRELAPYPVAARDATRRVQTITKNIRMILSGINLRMVINARPRSPR
jgi:hypothetical protein